MGLTVKLWEFRKRENSTLQPDDTWPMTEWDCVLKDNCSLMAPQITINFGYLGNPSFYNYAHISGLGNRYYFIRDWVCEHGYIWTAQLQVDVLASWRYRIGESTQYLERSSYASDGGVVDAMYPAKQPPNIQTVNLASHWFADLNQGSYVLGILNGDDGGVGAAHYYAFTQAQLNSFMAYLLGDESYTLVDEISASLTKTLFNPMQYIVSAVWYPFKIKGTAETVKFGWWTSSVTAADLTTTIYRFTDEITLPTHPQAARGAYLRKAPYSNYTLYYPGVGTVALNTAELDNQPISVQCAVDVVANQARLTITTTGSSTHIVSQTYTQLGVPIQLAQFTGDVLGAAGKLVSAGKNLLAHNFAGAVFDAVGSALDTFTPDVDSISANGSIVSISYAIQLRALFYLLVDEDNADLGRPLCKAGKVSEYPGYQKIIHPDVAITGTAEESAQIRAYMEAGYFYE